MVEQNPQETPPRPRGAFVGRQREMGELASAFERAVAGHGRVVLLAGEPGIGKTRIANEFAEIAGWRGARIAWGRCYEGGGAPPYWPWIQVLRGLIRSIQNRDIASRLGAGAAYLAELIPEIREQPTSPALPAMDSPESARFRLFDSVVSLLTVATEKAPVLATLDDIHWADESSLQLLEFVGQQIGDIPVILIGTYRHTDLHPQHPLFRTLGGLNRVQGFTRIDVTGITQDDVASYIRQSAGIEPPDSLIRSVHAQTKGNPLFVTETVRLLLQEGELSQERISSQRDWSIRIPDGIREALGRRLDRLSVPCRQALEAASIFGRRFEADELARVLRVAGGDSPAAIELSPLLDVLDEAVRAYLIERLQRVEQYQFTHPLIREVLYTHLPTGRRIQLHSIVAESLEAAVGTSLSLNRVAELANHYALAQPVGSREKVIKYTMLAGERALASLASDEAAQIFERCLGLVLGKVSDLEIAHLSLGAGRAYAQSMKGAQAIDHLEQAFELGLRNGLNEIALTAAETRLDLLTTPLDRWHRLVAAGLKLVQPGTQGEAVLRIREAWIGGARGTNFKSALQSADRAAELARGQRADQILVDALMTGATIATWSGDWDATIAKSTQVLERAHASRQLGAVGAAHFNAASALLELGRPDQARPHINSALENARGTRTRLDLASALVLPVAEAALRGAWSDARLAHQEACKVWPEDPRHLLIRAMVEYQQGDYATGEQFLLPALQSAESSQAVFPVLLEWPLFAWISGQTDRLDQAAVLAGQIVKARPPDTLITWLARACLGVRACIKADRTTASEQYGPLSTHSNCLVATSVSMDRLLGNLAQVNLETQVADRHYLQAIQWCRKAGYLPELAWSLHDRARLHLGRSGGIDRSLIQTLLKESNEIGAGLGMKPLLGKIAVLDEALA
ncbi:MAG: AAA family ATPase [Chloroflexi bacterium]|nr:AAA family ATPase [Chloroflexota bacterium]